MRVCDLLLESFGTRTAPGRLSTVAFAAVCFLLSTVLLSTGRAFSEAPRVVINEVHYHPADDAREGEFVELLNHGENEVDVGGWGLGGGVQIVIPQGTKIAAGGFLLLAKNRVSLIARYGLDSSIVVGDYTGSLSNGGERLSLVTAAGYLISFVDYDDSDPWPQTPDGLGPSLERISPLAEDADPRSWAASVFVGGTPGATNSASVEPGEGVPPAERDLVINELLAMDEPETSGDGWVELFNPTDEEVDASARRLSGFPRTTAEFTIPENTRVPARGFVVFTEAELGFELDPLPVLTLTTGARRFVDAFNPRNAEAGHSNGRFPDGSSSRIVFTDPTRSATNEHEPDDRIVISEIQYHPSDANPGTEYVELYNRSFDIIDLEGWAFTRGISFEFPEGYTLFPGRYLVVARDPAAVMEAYGLDQRFVAGPYRGSLRNDAETLLLRDPFGNPADRCRYADEGSWPEVADGEGPSVELKHSSLENRYGPAWAASDGTGTPGARNSRHESNPRPVVVGVSHHPVVPTGADSVRVLASLTDNAFIADARLYWEIDGSGDEPLSRLMRDDGIQDDGVAGNRIYGADLPPAEEGAIVAFWIIARDSSTQEAVAPVGAPDPAFLYQVETLTPQTPRPLYRVIMRQALLDELRMRGIGSNELLDTTFVANGKAYYNRGIRLRGSSARLCDPLSYRVQFDHDVDLHGIKRLNLNGCRVHRQWIGYDFLTRTGLPTPLVWLRKMSFNGDVGDDLYLRVEAIDEQFLERTMAQSPGGNLYRGVSRAYLDYRGDDPEEYRLHYPKYSNEESDDYSDLISLCFGFDDETTSDEDFPAFVESSLDVEQWALYFAAFACLGSTENSILLDSGDDYFLYHCPSDDLWTMLPWDLDSCFDEAEQPLFRPTVDSVERFLEHPRYAASYWCHLRWMVDNFFDPETISARLDHLLPLMSSARVNALKNFVEDRHEFITGRLERELAFEVAGGAQLCEGELEVIGDTLSLEGRVPSCGTVEVHVNDEPVEFDPILSRWFADIDVASHSRVEIVAHDRFGSQIDSTELTFVNRSSPSPLPSTISDVRTLRRSGSPYRLTNNVTVLSNGRLIIEPGVDVLFNENATLRIQGQLVVQGTDEDPVRFHGEECGSSWEGLEFRPGSTGNVLENVKIVGALAADSRGAAMWISGSDVRIAHCKIRLAAEQAIRVENGGSIELEGTLIADAENGLGISDSDATIVGCRFRSIGNRAIWARGPGVSPIQASATVIEHSGLALELTDRAEIELSHSTLYGNTTGFALRQDGGDAGPGRATVDSVILWGSPLPVFQTSDGLLDIAYSNASLPLPPGEGNLQTDPLFTNAVVGDYRLLAESPCRGTGKDGTDMGAFPYEDTPVTHSFVLCDSNADGAHDVSDVVFTLLALFAAGDQPMCQIAADCNTDRAVNVSDAVFDLAYLFGGEQAPRAPYPLCDEAAMEICESSTCSR